MMNSRTDFALSLELQLHLLGVILWHSPCVIIIGTCEQRLDLSKSVCTQDLDRESGMVLFSRTENACSRLASDLLLGT